MKFLPDTDYIFEKDCILPEELIAHYSCKIYARMKIRIRCLGDNRTVEVTALENSSAPMLEVKPSESIGDIEDVDIINKGYIPVSFIFMGYNQKITQLCDTFLQR